MICSVGGRAAPSHTSLCSPLLLSTQSIDLLPAFKTNTLFFFFLKFLKAPPRTMREGLAYKVVMKTTESKGPRVDW